jgi:predicted NBD/HSP70 family sugar kinase
LVSIYEIFNNELFILGGSMSKEPYDLVKLIKHNIDKNFEFIGREFPDIKISNFQSDSGLIGAALLAQHE